MLKYPCRLAYIAQTTRTIKTRINEQKSCIRTFKGQKRKIKYGETTAARHFFEKRHTISEIKWVIVETVYGDDRQMKKRLLQREVYWITTLETLAPKGLNENGHCNIYV